MGLIIDQTNKLHNLETKMLQKKLRKEQQKNQRSVPTGAANSQNQSILHDGSNLTSRPAINISVSDSQ